MSAFSLLENLTPVSGGLSPAAVFRGEYQGQTVYLKKISPLFSGTTYSVLREAKAMEYLGEHLPTPKVLDSGFDADQEWLMMSEIHGKTLDEAAAGDPAVYVEILAYGIHRLHQLPVANCPLDSRLPLRLEELRFLLDHGLADTDRSHWEGTTEFEDPELLYRYLLENQPDLDPVVTHGDLPANFCVQEDGAILYWDLGRLGIADRWQDLSLCIRELQERYPDPKWTDEFLRQVGVPLHEKKWQYYLLLDELF